MSDFSIIPLVINQGNAKPANTPNNVLSYTFPQQLVVKDKELALQTFSTPYSWPNVASQYSNQTVSYIFNGVTYPVTFPTGFYPVADIAGFIQKQMQTAGQYLLDNNGNPVFFLTFVENPVYYAVTLEVNPIPTILPTGWTNPHSISLSGNSPQLVVTNQNFGNLIGFLTGTYPVTPQTVIYDVNSTFIPQISPTSVVNIRCSLVNFPTYNTLPDVIYSFTPGDASYGSTINITPPQLAFFAASSGSYQNVIITLSDQNNAPITNLDPTMTITLVIRDRVVVRK